MTTPKDTPCERFLSGQNALVTGGSSGIGAACCIELARRGANIGVNYLTAPDAAEDVAEKCREYDVKAETYKADVSKPGDVNKMFKSFLDYFNRLDIMIANAGIQKDAPLPEMDFQEWEKVINVNLTGQFLCAQKSAQIFLDQGPAPEISRATGKIIHISSVHDEIPWAGRVNYAASKGGIKILMESIAQELAEHKIRVNAISPGAIKTDINKETWSDEDKAEALKDLIPYHRIGQPEDIAEPAAWLASDYADYITGETIYIDGGMLLYPGFKGGG